MILRSFRVLRAIVWCKFQSADKLIIFINSTENNICVKGELYIGNMHNFLCRMLKIWTWFQQNILHSKLSINFWHNILNNEWEDNSKLSYEVVKPFSGMKNRKYNGLLKNMTSKSRKDWFKRSRGRAKLLKAFYIKKFFFFQFYQEK